MLLTNAAFSAFLFGAAIAFPVGVDPANDAAGGAGSVVGGVVNMTPAAGVANTAGSVVAGTPAGDLPPGHLVKGATNNKRDGPADTASGVAGTAAGIPVSLAQTGSGAAQDKAKNAPKPQAAAHKDASAKSGKTTSENMSTKKTGKKTPRGNAVTSTAAGATDGTPAGVITGALDNAAPGTPATPNAPAAPAGAEPKENQDEENPHQKHRTPGDAKRAYPWDLLTNGADAGQNGEGAGVKNAQKGKGYAAKTAGKKEQGVKQGVTQ